MATTTIQLDSSTRARLARLKSNPRQTYDELLNRLIDLVPEADEDGPFQDAFRIGLLDARLEVRAGRVYEHDDVKRRLGV